MADLIEPKDFHITDQSGTERHYKLGKLPYLAGGREVCSQYITTAAPRVGDYQANEQLTRKLFSHVAIVTDNGSLIRLTTDELVNNHVPDFVTGIKLEEAALEHNMGFSVIGKLREYRQAWLASIPELISNIVMQLRQSSPTPDNAPDTSSKPSTQ